MSEKPMKASKLIWWIARMALRYDSKCRRYREMVQKPRVGDIVVEYTHIIGMKKTRCGLYSAIGELLSIEEHERGETEYVIRTIEGDVQRWKNAEFLIVEAKGE